MTYAYYVLVPFQICALYRLSSEIYSLVEPEKPHHGLGPPEGCLFQIQLLGLLGLKTN